MKRIAIIGSSGSGKTSLAKRIEAVLNIKAFYLDEHLWQNNWRIKELNEWNDIISRFTDRPEWIIDGNYCKVLESRIKLSDLIILLDFPVWYCLLRVVNRLVRHYGRPRPGVHSGCPERLNIRYFYSVATFRKRMYGVLLRRIAVSGSNDKLIILRSDDEVNRFVETLKKLRYENP